MGRSIRRSARPAGHARRASAIQSAIHKVAASLAIGAAFAIFPGTASADLTYSGDVSVVQANGAYLLTSYIGTTGQASVVDNGSTLYSEDGSPNFGGGELGEDYGSTGTLTLTSAATFINPGDLVVGNEGTGYLYANSLTLIDSINGIIGSNYPGGGVVTIDHSIWDIYNSIADVTGTLVTFNSSMAGILSVGNSGGGTLNVQNSGLVTDLNGYIGAGNGAIGQVNVSSNGNWTNGDLIVGYEGRGTLAITTGGQVSAAYGYVGESFAPFGGLVTINGANSKLIITSYSNIGDAGSGTVNVSNGGYLTSPYLGIGAGTNNSGMLTVDGASSSAMITGNLSSGQTANGLVSITNGALINVTYDCTLGYGPKANGVITADGEKSLLNVGLDTYVGENGVGTLSISNSATFISLSDVTVADQERSGGTINVEGTGFKSANQTLWQPSGNLTIGNNGVGAVNVSGDGLIVPPEGTYGNLAVGQNDTGTLDVNTGGIVNIGGEIDVANASESTGVVVVTGADADDNDSNLVAESDMTIGEGGNGTLEISEGGRVTIGGDAIIADTTDSSGTVTVDGTDSADSPSTWTILGNLTVGNQSGAASLSITNGAIVNTGGDSAIGNEPDSSGSVTIDGGDGDGNFSTWTTIGDLNVGVDGTGTIDVTNNAVLSNQGTAYIGVNADGTGTVTIDNGNWIVGQINYSEGEYGTTVNVGFGGIGTLNVQNGGYIDCGAGVIGANQGSQGTADVTGAGSNWNNIFFLNVGNDGQGTLTIENEGTVNSPNVDIGVDPTGVGSVSVNDATFNCGNYLVVGDAGSGTLMVTNSSVADGSVAIVGNQAGSTGTLSADGSGSSLQFVQQMTVGMDGTGSLSVTGGATASSASADVGVNSDGNGTVTVDGAGSSWTNAGSVIIGDSGTGLLTISGGASVASMDGTIGASAGGNGSVTVDGGGSSWTNVGSVTVGDSGTGSLTISGGASVASVSGTIGASAGGNGTLNVTGVGSSWNLGASDLTIGDSDSGSGVATIQSGGSILCVNGNIGQSTGSFGNMAVIGTGSSWTLSGDLDIGVAQRGTMSISSGASVTNATSTLGDLTTGSANVTVDGTGGVSKWAMSGNFYIGNSGQATFTVQNKGAVSAAGVSIGTNSGSSGTATITGGGSTLTTGQMVVGLSGNATLNVKAKGSLTDTEGDLATGKGSVATVTIDGAGTTWFNNGPLTVGDFGDAAVTVSNGGGMDDTNGFIALSAGSTSSVTLTGKGSLWYSAGSLYVGGSATAAGGIGTLNVESGASVMVNGSLVIYDPPATSVNLDGGSISAASLSGDFMQTGGTATFGKTTGSGQLTISGGQTMLNSSGGTSEVGGLAISGSGSLDLTNNPLFINYGIGKPSPISAIESYLQSGYNGGAWNGPGAISSAVANLNASQSALIYSIGYADGSDGITGVPSGEIEIMPTLAGDAKMQGNVVFGDFQLLSQYFGQSGTSWDEGNFSYESTTNFGDFQLLSQNFGANSSALTAGEIASLDSFAAQFGEEIVANPDGTGFSVISVPEPSLGIFTLAAIVGFRRRRKILVDN